MCENIWDDRSRSYDANFTLTPRKNGIHIAENIFNSIFFIENLRMLIQIPLKLDPDGSGDDLASYGGQVITCTNYDPVNWHWYVSLGVYVSIAK